MSEWQPIETAPKDGTRVLAARKWKKGQWVYRIAHWADRGLGNWVSDPGEWLVQPTHWQPLPPAPEDRT